MKKNEIQLLLIVIGIVCVVASWQLVYNNYQEKAQKIEEENVPIKARLDQLEMLNAQKGEYEEQTVRMHDEATAIINTFPPGFRNEDIIMYLYNMELIDDNEVAVKTLGMDDEVEIPYTGVLDVDGYSLVDDGIGLHTNKNTLTFLTTYNGLKNVLNYVYGISTRKSVASVSLTATDDGYLNGTMEMNFYALSGTELPYVETDILGVPTGTSNFFGVRNGTLADLPEEGEEGAGAEGAGADAGNQ